MSNIITEQKGADKNNIISVSLLMVIQIKAKRNYFRPLCPFVIMIIIVVVHYLKQVWPFRAWFFPRSVIASIKQELFFSKKVQHEKKKFQSNYTLSTKKIKNK